MPIWIFTSQAPEPGPPPAAAQPSPQCQRWFVFDLLGLVFALGVWLLVLSAAWVLLRDLLLPSRDLLYGVANGVLFHLLAALALASHLRTMFTDPGSVPLVGPPEPDSQLICPCCLRARPERAHHCPVCGRCIRKMDHHCPWINNCVGEDNQRYFLLFTFYIMLGCLHLLLLMGVSTLRSYQRGEWTEHTMLSLPPSLIFLFLVALNGFLLAFVMFSIQMYSVCTDTTGMECLQRDRSLRSKGSMWENLKAVCGLHPSVAWINPFASPEPRRVSTHQDVVV